jgi:hypothetical protein
VGVDTTAGAWAGAWLTEGVGCTLRGGGADFFGGGFLTGGGVGVGAGTGVGSVGVGTVVGGGSSASAVGAKTPSRMPPAMTSRRSGERDRQPLDQRIVDKTLVLPYDDPEQGGIVDVTRSAFETPKMPVENYFFGFGFFAGLGVTVSWNVAEPISGPYLTSARAP